MPHGMSKGDIWHDKRVIRVSFLFFLKILCACTTSSLPPTTLNPYLCLYTAFVSFLLFFPLFLFSFFFLSHLTFFFRNQ
ncbi:Uncharacterized protein TCM_018365 [Theobroma cacao]|uniref:Uncharacterized protein n=1 Tax=Theobroma cacao TaxID=3641 RepID=A0A061EG65_THECC|nr:Uncharacterized protein TCM_018365 [Theobroma cacao]